MTFLDDTILPDLPHTLHRQPRDHLGPTKHRTHIRVLDRILASDRLKPTKPRSSP